MIGEYIYVTPPPLSNWLLLLQPSQPLPSILNLCNTRISVLPEGGEFLVAIDKIIAHLKLTFMAERPPPSQIVQKKLLMAAEERGEYF